MEIVAGIQVFNVALNTEEVRYYAYLCGNVSILLIYFLASIRLVKKEASAPVFMMAVGGTVFLSLVAFEGFLFFF